MSAATIPDGLRPWVSASAPRLDCQGWRRCEAIAANNVDSMRSLWRPSAEGQPHTLSGQEARALLAYRAEVAKGLTRAEREFMVEVEHVTSMPEFAGVSTGRLHRRATAERLRGRGLLDCNLMEVADGDGFTIDTRKPRPAYFFTDWGREIAAVLRGDS